MLKCVIIHVLTICMHHLIYLLGYGDVGLQDAQDAMDNLIHQFGVYADEVNVIFDEEELTDSDDEDFQATQDEAPNATRNLIDRQRQDIYEDLLQLSTNGTLQRNSTTLIAAKYHVHVRTIRVW